MLDGQVVTQRGLQSATGDHDNPFHPGFEAVADGVIKECFTIRSDCHQLFVSPKATTQASRQDEQRRVAHRRLSQSAVGAWSRSPRRKASRARSPRPSRFNSKV